MFSRKKQPPIKSLVAQGTKVEGDVHFSEGLRIDGEVVGDIRAAPGQPSILVISESARVEGAVHADHVIVNGVLTLDEGRHTGARSGMVLRHACRA